MYKLRKLGLNVKCFEAGSDLGGVWYWNRYPGARVDSEFPFYTLSIPEVYTTWTWSSRFPDHKELRRHFSHIDKVLDISKDAHFNARVNSATWDDAQGKWTVTSEAGHTARCKYLFLATGLLHRKHYPEFTGLENYKGLLQHSGSWPEDVSVKGKKVAIIGAGATAVQITQEVAKEADALTVFMRRPSYCIAMKQREISVEEQAHLKSYYRAMLAAGRNSAAGFPVRRPDVAFWDTSAEERKAHWEEAWSRGAFNFPMTNYAECALDPKANREAYEFWASKVRPRIKDAAKRELMAPTEPPYYFGTKRAPLERDYYEMLDQDHVDIVDMKKVPLKAFNETGMLMEDGVQRDYDIVILATGFDSFSGSYVSCSSIQTLSRNANMQQVNADGPEKQGWG
jgi:cation diffusion facilitator CzcD-associated flavoprotein CzcO